MSFLDIRNLTVKYMTDNGVVNAVNNISLHMEKSSTLGLVGETGAGKTTTALAILRLIASPPGKIMGGEIFLEGEDLLKLKESDLQEIRGKRISMIFQDPMTALNPLLPVGEQIAEVIYQHQRVSRIEAKLLAEEMLEKVGISGERSGDYPHQFSGGMRQRVVIAIALACDPELLIADEPTTALDVTIQAQVLNMIKELRDSLGTSMLLITHDLGIVAETCDYVAVMYAGEIVEFGSLKDIFKNPLHPYTNGLFNSLPRLNEDVEWLKPIPGLMPDPTLNPQGCRFADRCEYATALCQENPPEDVEFEPGHMIRCHRFTKETRVP